MSAEGGVLSCSMCNVRIEDPQADPQTDPSNRRADKIDVKTAAAILGCNTSMIKALFELGKLRFRKGLTVFSRQEVEKFAREVIFLPEILRKAGFVSRAGAMAWLDKEGCRPMFWFGRRPKTPIFSREQFNRLLAKPMIGNTHPEEVKRRLLDMVACGSTVHAAAKACDVKYATAKRWVC
jgi:hypothetical protein